MLNSIKGSKWFDPAVIFTFIGLLISNGVFVYQDIQANRRADRDEERADDLLKKKDDWLEDLDDKIDQLSQRIGSVKISLETDEIAGTTMVGQESIDASSNIRADSAQLNELQQEKASLEKQRNDLETTYR